MLVTFKLVEAGTGRGEQDNIARFSVLMSVFHRLRHGAAIY